jgi:putative aldouronate transport system substrate-binding protein
VHWAKKAHGKYTMLPSLSNPKILAIKSYIDPPLSLNQSLKLPFETDPKIPDSVKAHHSKLVQLRLPPDSESYLKYAANILTLKKEIMAKVIMGTYSVDEGLGKYKEKLAKLNVAQILKEANTKK